MKKQIPVLDKDKQQKVWIKVRKIDRNFNLDELAHRHTYEELIWIKSGTGSQLIDEETIKLQANTLYLMATRLTLFISFCKDKGASIFSGIGVSEYRFAVVEIAQC